MRKLTALTTLALLSLPAPIVATPAESARGIYLEARSAQVFIGGCIMSSEAHTMGREAVLTWHVEEGIASGQPLDGLTIVAAIAGDQNLALYPEAPRNTVLYVDRSASAAQQEALASLFAARYGRTFGEIVGVVGAEIDFAPRGEGYRVQVGEAVKVAADAIPPHHQDLVSCGEMEWYEPFVDLRGSTIAVAHEYAYRGDGLGIRWSDPHGQSAYFGDFSF